MTLAPHDPTYYAWHPSYGVEDEQAAAREHERRQKAQAAIEWLVDHDMATARVAVNATTIADLIDLRAALEAAYLAGLDDKEDA